MTALLLALLAWPAAAIDPAAERACRRAMTPSLLLAELDAMDAAHETRGVRRRLLEHHQCLALLADDQSLCAPLGELRSEGRLEGWCRDGFLMTRFLQSSLSSDPAQRRKGLGYCRAYAERTPSALPVRLPDEPFCSLLAEAYRSAYSPICAALVSSGRLLPEADPYTAQRFCGLVLYPASGCGIVSPELPILWACETRSRTLRALKEGGERPCGKDLLCRAALRPSERDCAALAEEAAREFFALKPGGPRQRSEALASGADGAAAAAAPPDDGHALRVGSREEFDRLSSPGEHGPTVLALVDHRDGDRTYYLDSRRYTHHLDFLHGAYLSLDRGDILAQYAVDSDSRPFTLAFLARETEDDVYELRFWPDDDMDAATLERVHAAVAASFFKPPLFVPSSVYQTERGMAAARVPRRPYAPSQPRYAALSRGSAYGALRRLEAYDPGSSRVGPGDVLILGAEPRELPAAAGVLIAAPTSSPAQLSILARSLGIPLATAAGALERHRELDGRIVRFEVAGDRYLLEPARPEEARRRGPAPSRGRFPLMADLGERSLADLGEQRASDAIRFGAESANLGEALRAGPSGFSVPRGFTIPFYYYGEFVRENGLAAEIREAASDPELADDPVRRRDRLAALRARMLSGRLPAGLAAALSKKLRREYPGTGLSARSSTNSEDLPGFSDAGLYDTVPNVRGEAAVFEAVKTVWASIWNDRAYEARERAGIDHATALPAVLIQEGGDALPP